MAISLIMAMFVAGISFAFLYLGFLMFKKESLVLTSNIMTNLIGVNFLIIITGMLSKFFSSNSKNWGILIFVFIYIGIFFLVKKMFGRLMVFNIEENVLYRHTLDILNRNNLNIERRKNKIIIPSLNAQIIINNHKALKTATLHVSSSQQEDDFFEKLIPVFKQEISGKKFNQFSWVGFLYVLIGLLIFAVALGFVLAGFSRS